MSSNTGFDGLVAKTCDTLILYNLFLFFPTSVFVCGAQCKQISKLADVKQSLTGVDFKVSGYLRANYVMREFIQRLNAYTTRRSAVIACVVCHAPFTCQTAVLK